MRAVRVEVTADDIALGESKDCERCPIALALKRAGALSVQVGDDLITADFGDGELEASPPKEALRFIAAFDAGGYGVPSVAPFAFDAAFDVPFVERDEDDRLEDES